LALAVEAHHHDGLLLARLDLARRAEDLDELVVHDLDDELARLQARRGLFAQRAPLDLARELERELHVDVGLEQRALDVAHHLLDRLLVDRARLRDLGERRAQALAQGVEDHRIGRRRVRLSKRLGPPSPQRAATAAYRRSRGPTYSLW